jgi:uncharacterized membrane protein
MFENTKMAAGMKASELAVLYGCLGWLVGWFVLLTVLRFILFVLFVLFQFYRRYKQVDSLRQYFPTVKEVQKDALYEVPVLLPTKTNITIRM